MMILYFLATLISLHLHCRIAKVIFCLCITITVCSLAVRIYISDIHILTVRTSYNTPGTATSTSNPKSNFLQRILHSALDPLSPRGSEILDTSPANKTRTLLAIERFSKSQPPNSSYGDKFYNEIVQRTRLREAQSYPQERNYVVDSQFINYLKCPTTVRTKILQHGFSVKKFLPEVPMLMFNEHFSRSEYQRLSKFLGINGWQDMDVKDISETLRSLKSPNNRYLFDDRLVDGYVPNNVSCIRCAVIGNGGILRGSGIGREIDAHDYVFRVNVALTKGHEEDVGSKTSFYCFTMVTLSNSLRGGSQFGFRTPPYQKGIRYVFFADNEWTYQYLSAVLNNKPAPRSVDRFKRTPPIFPKGLTAEDIKLVHPDFQRYLRYSWVNSTAQHKTVHRPTTGAIMLLLALHTCDEVNVYGFAGSYSKFSEHYYDKKFQKHIFFANHDNNAENALWRQLDQLGIINLYTRQ